MQRMALSALEIGQCGIVCEVSATGDMRRRLLELGLLPGTLVHCRLRSPFGDPTGYQIEGALIALRNEDASDITVELREQP